MISGPSAGAPGQDALRAGSFPYDHIGQQQNWRTVVTNVDNSRIDPQRSPKFMVDRSTKIASAGSCFAQRIAESLQEYGFNYWVTEPGPQWLSGEQRALFNYGVYSARYGNVYTTLQLLQLLQRASGQFTPLDSCWLDRDGHFIDPFRPSIQPDGFSSKRELERDRAGHLLAVTRLIEELDVLVFTLGLTETWCSAVDGAAFPTCPGKRFGAFDPERYVFRNLGVQENLEYLDSALELLRQLNPAAKVILTVSPVPLAATMEDKHVLDATTYSKAVLRVVAEEMRRKHDYVDYFASYEIATATFNNAAYFQDDKRNVTPAAVDHVMWSFYRNFVGEDISEMAKVERAEQELTFEHTPCDEEQLLRLINGE